MIAKERDIRPIGYGAMVLEGFVAVTALVAACALEPGDYFAINVAQATPSQKVAYTNLVEHHQTAESWDLRPKELPDLEQGTNEKLTGRVGGAVTLAVGMAKVFSSFPGMKHLMAYWYHFVIMFEALFILTLLETGTRVARFVFQETLTGVNEVVGQVEARDLPFINQGQAVQRPRWGLNVGMSLLVCLGWGYLLYRGELKTLWGMLGIANQLLASIALAVGTTYLLNHAPKRKYALCTGIPFLLVIITVFTAGVKNIQMWWGQTATVPAEQVFLLKLMCILAGIMLGLTALIALDAIRKWWSILASPVSEPTTQVVAAGRS
jgi:carbon starvation protein